MAVNSLHISLLAVDCQYIRGCLHESGLSFNLDRTHSVSVEIIGDWIIIVYMNQDWVATHSGSSSLHFSFFIPDWTLDPEWNVDSESCKLGSKFHSWMKLGVKSTFIMVGIKIDCKMGSFATYISAKIAGKIRLLVHESETSFNPEWDFHSPWWSFNPQLNLPCKHELSLKCRSGLKLNPDLCKLPLSLFAVNFIYIRLLAVNPQHIRLVFLHSTSCIWVFWLWTHNTSYI